MLSDEELIAEFGRRKRRQWRLVWMGLPAFIAWGALVFTVMGVMMKRNPAWNSPWVATGGLLPFFVAFVVVAVRFTSKNLVCPACEAPIIPRTHRYYVSGFACPRCARRLS